MITGGGEFLRGAAEQVVARGRGRASGEGSAEAAALLEEIAAALDRPAGDPGWRLQLPRSERFGAARATIGLGPDELVRELAGLLASAEELGIERGALDEPAAWRRFREVVDEVLARALSGYEGARRERRAAWLSFYCHELANPLNTIVNALWLLRDDRRGAEHRARFVELAERAARRLQSGLRDVRELERRAAATPPRRPRPAGPEAAEPPADRGGAEPAAGAPTDLEPPSGDEPRGR